MQIMLGLRRWTGRPEYTMKDLPTLILVIEIGNEPGQLAPSKLMSEKVWLKGLADQNALRNVLSTLILVIELGKEP